MPCQPADWAVRDGCLAAAAAAAARAAPRAAAAADVPAAVPSFADVLVLMDEARYMYRAHDHAGSVAKVTEAWLAVGRAEIARREGGGEGPGSITYLP